MRSLKQLATWVTPEMQGRIKSLAELRGITVSNLLGELADEAVNAGASVTRGTAGSRDTRRQRISIRLQPGDIAAVGRRAVLRRMRPATYIAALVRSHLVEDPPLPPAELAVVERAVAEISAIGRNLNQITRAVNSGASLPPGAETTIGMAIEAVEVLREAIKAYLRKAIASWEAPLG